MFRHPTLASSIDKGQHSTRALGQFITAFYNRFVPVVKVEFTPQLPVIKIWVSTSRPRGPKGINRQIVYRPRYVHENSQMETFDIIL